jgi:hypothetical protein
MYDTYKCVFAYVYATYNTRICRVAKYVSTLKQIHLICTYYMPYCTYDKLFYLYHTPYCTYLIRIYTYLFEHLIRFGTTLRICIRRILKKERIGGNPTVQCFFRGI